MFLFKRLILRMMKWFAVLEKTCLNEYCWKPSLKIISVSPLGHQLHPADTLHSLRPSGGADSQGRALWPFCQPGWGEGVPNAKGNQEMFTQCHVWTYPQQRCVFMCMLGEGGKLCMAACMCADKLLEWGFSSQTTFGVSEPRPLQQSLHTHFVCLLLFSWKAKTEW